MRFSIAVAGFLRMAAQHSPEIAYPLASMQQDMNDLGFGTVANDPLGNFEKCDYGQPCLSTTTGCAKGQCARRAPSFQLVKPAPGFINYTAAPSLTASA